LPSLPTIHSPFSYPPNRYDDLANYTNERSPWVAGLREAIEAPWQEWELAQLLASADVAQGEVVGSLDGYRALSPEQLKQALTARWGGGGVACQCLARRHAFQTNP
jgi:predicted transcriptional regulator